MITCLGLIVGLITSANRSQLATQCLGWLQSRPYLLDGQPISFEVERIPYLTLTDFTQDEDGNIYGEFTFCDGDLHYVTTATL